jgi:hypothetical protein
MRIVDWDPDRRELSRNVREIDGVFVRIFLAHPVVRHDFEQCEIHVFAGGAPLQLMIADVAVLQFRGTAEKLRAPVVKILLQQNRAEVQHTEIVCILAVHFREV